MTADGVHAVVSGPDDAPASALSISLGTDPFMRDAPAAGIPDALLVSLSEAPHIASVEQADSVTRVLIEHLEKNA